MTVLISAFCLLMLFALVAGAALVRIRTWRRCSACGLWTERHTGEQCQDPPQNENREWCQCICDKCLSQYMR